MKRILILLLMFPLFSSFAPAQANEQKIENNLYFKALSAALEKSEEIAKATNNRDYLSSLYDVIVEKDAFTNENFPARINSFKVEYLDLTELSARYKKKKERFQVLVLRPMINENGSLMIGVTKYWFSSGKGKKIKVYQSYEGGIEVTFSYDCNKREYVINKVEPWGY